MNLTRFIVFCCFALIFAACSSSSYYNRFKTPKEDKKETERPSRFSSDNDKAPDSKDGDEIINYRNPGNKDEEFDEDPEEDYPVDSREYLTESTKNISGSSRISLREKVLMEILKYIDTPYQYGGENRQGIDCSAFTQKIYNSSLDISLPRSAKEQFSEGQLIRNKNELGFGDLVFFNTTKNSYPGHVGIYIGDDLFAHASQSRGVTISSLKSSYYKNRFVGGRRLNRL